MDLTCNIVTLKSIALKLFVYFNREAKRGRLLCSLKDPRKRTYHALGIDRRLLTTWLSESRVTNNPSKREKSGRKEKIDNFDKDVIQREIIKSFQEQECITLKRLKRRLRDKNDIHVSKSTLWRIMRKTGFRFRKHSSGKNVVCEKQHLVAARSKYLRQVREKRSQGYDIVYLDETWVNAHHTYDREWQSADGVHKREIPASKGHRIILAHAGSRNQGLIANSELVFQSHSKDNRDYHKEMNGEVFRNWLVDAILPSLDRPSCLVMDNASYHNTVSQEDKTPTSSSSKRELIEWLHKENIPFSEHSLKPELLSQVKKYRRPKTYQIDKIIQLFGHTTIRLPPYHCHLNPIELVWAKVKGTVARENKTFKLSDVKELTAAAIRDVDKAFFSRCEDHVLKLEDEYWQKDGLSFLQLPMIIDPRETSDLE